MGLGYRLPNNREHIEQYGGVVIATNKAREILITLLPTGELHGYPITALVYRVPNAHLEFVIKELQDKGSENGEYSMLETKQVLSSLEDRMIIGKVGGFNYHRNEITELILGTPKEASIKVAGLGSAIQLENSFFENMDEDLKASENFKEDWELPLEDENLLKGIVVKGELTKKEFFETDLSFREFISTLIGFLNKYPGQFTIQETEPNNITLLISSPILPEVTFAGTIDEMANEFMPSFIKVMTKRKSGIDYIASLEKLIDKKKEEVSDKALDKSRDVQQPNYRNGTTSNNERKSI